MEKNKNCINIEVTMKRYFQWVLESNRPKHIAVGFLLGFILGMEAVFVASATAEIKDWMWNGKKGGTLGWLSGNGFDWLDFIATMMGGIVGFGLNRIIF